MQAMIPVGQSAKAGRCRPKLAKLIRRKTRADENGSKPIFKVPTIKEYFQDLDYILNVIADGPAKSFAWRRLRYLESKWNLYVLLNEYQELADMKVCGELRCLIFLWLDNGGSAYLTGSVKLHFNLARQLSHYVCRDFYNVRKVDTHVHHSACMNQKHLLRFIKSKMKRSPDVRLIRRGLSLTLN
jgi:AMP deaminase